jgi:hypothetical protein
MKMRGEYRQSAAKFGEVTTLSINVQRLDGSGDNISAIVLS